MQTSTITVAVLPEASRTEVVVHPRDCALTYYRAGGPGGQHKNKTDSAVRIQHRPTGIVVRAEAERSQHLNRETAWAALRARLQADKAKRQAKARESKRKQQVGSGMRGDKRRTIRMQDDSVVDHVLGKRTSAKKYMRGNLDAFYENRDG